jgi:hypothetical protein
MVETQASGAAQLKFESQWRVEEMPACDEGMILLRRFAEAQPNDFAFLKLEDIEHLGISAFTGIAEWDSFSHHVSECAKCNEV